ncbi:VWA domain-containing protein, partial [Acidobacteriota bacterium]
IDTSRSMIAEDVKPNRLEAAKREVVDLIELLTGDRIGVVTFAGKSFLHCPLTLDYAMAQTFLRAVDTDVISVPGTTIDSAIRTSIRAFNPRTSFNRKADPFIHDGKEVVDVEEKRFRILILVTDGEDHGTDTLQAAKEAAEQGIVIFTVGVGTGEGVPIPLYDDGGRQQGYKKDKDGKVILTRLNARTLEEIARTTGGEYVRILSGQNEMTKILDAVAAMDKKELEERMEQVREDRFQIFLALGLIFVCVEPLIPDRRIKSRQSSQAGSQMG